MTKKQRKPPQTPPPDRFRTIETQAVVKSLSASASKHVLVFRDMKLTRDQLADLTDLIEAQAEVRVQLAAVVNDDKQIEFESVVKTCKMNVNSEVPSFTPFKVSSRQVAEINDMIQSEEPIIVRIIQKQATLFPAGGSEEEEAGKDSGDND